MSRRRDGMKMVKYVIIGNVVCWIILMICIAVILDRLNELILKYHNIEKRIQSLDIDIDHVDTKVLNNKFVLDNTFKKLSKIENKLKKESKTKKNTPKPTKSV